MAKNAIALESPNQLVLAGQGGGLTVIPQPTPLTRLHYFDGKFLRASDLDLEQRYLRNLVALSNQAGGSGIVHGYDATLSGDEVTIGAGLAIDPEGRVLLLPEVRAFSLADLIAASRASGALALGPSGVVRLAASGAFGDCDDALADGSTATADGGALWVVTLFHAEGLCGEEDVYGKLCAEACATSTERPYVLEGVLVRAVPIALRTPLATSNAVPLAGKHRRSLTASAYFEDERTRIANLISAAGLASEAWCLGARPAGGAGVPISLVARAGSSTLFWDAWTARRERIEPPPRRYWAQIMAMRPWDVFLAQVLQFQCQLADCLNDDHGGGGPDDPCSQAHALLRDTAEQIARLLAATETARLSSPTAAAALSYLPAGYGQLDRIRGRLADAATSFFSAPRERKLIECGIVELPSAGYLPVDPQSALSVNEQVRRWMGEGVDLRFCVVRPDYVPHALEEAQHMERISLLAGIDNPNAKPKVDVLVPDGTIDAGPGVVAGQGYEMSLTFEKTFGPLVEFWLKPKDAQIEETPYTLFAPQAAGTSTGTEVPPLPGFAGSARGEDLPGGGTAFYFAGRLDAESKTGRQGSTWLALLCDRDPFDLEIHGSTQVAAECAIFATLGFDLTSLLRFDFHGELTVTDRRADADGSRHLDATLEGSLFISRTGNPASQSASNQIDIREVLTLGRANGTGGGPTVTIELPTFAAIGSGRLGLACQRRWPSAASAEAAAVLTRASDQFAKAFEGATRVSLPLFESTQKVSAEALAPGNPSHDASIAALDALSAALENPAYGDGRARKLFPPARPASDVLIVRATRDWVLFHRRRGKVCQAAAPVTQAAARRYRLLHVEVDNSGAQAELLSRLRAGLSLEGFELEDAGVVEFAGGIAALNTPTATLLDRWDDVAPANAHVVAGAIATEGDAESDGPSLASARLGNVARTVAALNPADPAASFEVLSTVSPELHGTTTDGSILLATLAVATQCAEVYQVEAGSLDPDDGISCANLVARLANSRHLGTVNFLPGGHAVPDGSLDAVHAAWAAAGSRVSRVWAVWIPQGGDGDLAAERADAIGRNLGAGDPTASDVHECSGAIPGGCSAVVLLFVDPAIQSVCNAVFAIKAPISSTALSAMAKTIVTSGVEPASMLQVPLDDVDFLDGTADPAPDAVDELLAQVKTIYGPDGMPKDASWQGFAISPAGSTDELRSLHREQSERIVHDLDRPIQVQSLLNGDVTPWPVDCAAITLFARLMQQTPPPPPPALKARRTRGGGKGAERKEP